MTAMMTMTTTRSPFSPMKANKTDRIRLRIDLSWSEMQAHYRGEFSRVGGMADDGRWVSLPTSALRPFLEQDGIHGWFDMQYDPETRRIVKLAALPDMENH